LTCARLLFWPWHAANGSELVRRACNRFLGADCRPTHGAPSGSSGAPSNPLRQANDEMLAIKHADALLDIRATQVLTDMPREHPGGPLPVLGRRLGLADGNWVRGNQTPQAIELVERAHRPLTAGKFDPLDWPEAAREKATGAKFCFRAAGSATSHALRTLSRRRPGRLDSFACSIS
jgi:hypothetical protein